MTKLDINLDSKHLVHRFDMEDDLKFMSLQIQITCYGDIYNELQQSSYKVVDRDRNIIDVYFDENLLDEKFSDKELEYSISVARIDTLNHGRVPQEMVEIFKGSITTY